MKKYKEQVHKTNKMAKAKNSVGPEEFEEDQSMQLRTKSQQPLTQPSKESKKIKYRAFNCNL